MSMQGRSTRYRRGATKVEYALVSSAILIVVCIFASASTPTPQLFEKVASDIQGAAQTQTDETFQVEPRATLQESTVVSTPLPWSGPVESMSMLTLSILFLVLLGCSWFAFKFA